MYYWIWRIGHVHVSLEDFRPVNDSASCNDGGDNGPRNRTNELMLVDKGLFCAGLDVCEDFGVQVLEICPEVVFQNEARCGAQVDRLVRGKGEDKDEVVGVVGQRAGMFKPLQTHN